MSGDDRSPTGDVLAALIDGSERLLPFNAERRVALIDLVYFETPMPLPADLRGRAMDLLSYWNRNHPDDNWPRGRPYRGMLGSWPPTGPRKSPRPVNASPEQTARAAARLGGKQRKG